MTDKYDSLFERALRDVENFSEKNVAVLPDKPPHEMLQYIAHVTGEDIDRLKRFYELFIVAGRLDTFKAQVETGSAGFAED